MDFSRSLWDITFLKVNTTTLIAPDQGPITSAQHTEILQSALKTTRNQASRAMGEEGLLQKSEG